MPSAQPLFQLPIPLAAPLVLLAALREQALPVLLVPVLLVLPTQVVPARALLLRPLPIQVVLVPVPRLLVPPIRVALVLPLQLLVLLIWVALVVLVLQLLGERLPVERLPVDLQQQALLLAVVEAAYHRGLSSLLEDQRSVLFLRALAFCAIHQFPVLAIILSSRKIGRWQ